MYDIKYIPRIINTDDVTPEDLIRFINSDITDELLSKYQFYDNIYQVFVLTKNIEYGKTQQGILINDSWAIYLIDTMYEGHIQDVYNFQKQIEPISRFTDTNGFNYKLLKCAHDNKVESLTKTYCAFYNAHNDIQDYILNTWKLPHNEYEHLGYLLEIIKHNNLNQYNKLLPTYELFNNIYNQYKEDGVYNIPHPVFHDETTITHLSKTSTAYEVFVSHCVMLLKADDTINYADIPLVIDYPVNWKSEELNYIYPLPIINVERVLIKYPDILDTPPRFSWWLDGIMPLCLYNILKQIKVSYTEHNYIYFESHILKFAELVSFIGLWSVLSESGTGSNAWLLCHPINEITFKTIAAYLLSPSFIGYDATIEALGYGELVITFKGENEINDINEIDEATLTELDKLINNILTNTDFEIFKSLSESVKWVKNIIKYYDINNYYIIETNLNEEPIFSPSGLCIVPFAAQS